MEAIYNIVVVLPYIDMNLPQVYMCFPSWTPVPSPFPSHFSGSSQCTSPEHPVSCIEPELVIRFTYDSIHVYFPKSFHPLPLPQSPKDFSIHLYLFCCLAYSYHYHLSKFHIYALVYCIGVFLSGLLYSVMEKAMAPHSSTLAWKIPWMEEPGRLQSMGSLRVGHDWSNLAVAAAYCIDVFLSGLLHSV